MTDLRTAAQQALEALEMCRLNGSQYLYGNERDLIFSAIKALRAALAQQAEPVADPFNCPKCGRHDYGLHGACPTCDAQQAEPVCKCDLRTRLVGDGCEVCNPKLAAELAQQAEPDWQDLYLKEKQRADMWRDKYESVAGAEQRIYPQAEPVPVPPFPPVSQWNRGCAVCGIGADGRAYAYVCPRSDCPTKVTSGGVA